MKREAMISLSPRMKLVASSDFISFPLSSSSSCCSFIWTKKSTTTPSIWTLPVGWMAITWLSCTDSERSVFINACFSPLPAVDARLRYCGEISLRSVSSYWSILSLKRSSTNFTWYVNVPVTNKRSSYNQSRLKQETPDIKMMGQHHLLLHA